MQGPHAMADTCVTLGATCYSEQLIGLHFYTHGLQVNGFINTVILLSTDLAKLQSQEPHRGQQHPEEWPERCSLTDPRWLTAGGAGERGSWRSAARHAGWRRGTRAARPVRQKRERARETTPDRHSPARAALHSVPGLFRTASVLGWPCACFCWAGARAEHASRGGACGRSAPQGTGF